MVYFTMITLSTIGYGDFCPATIEGRFIIMVAAIWGGVLLSLFVTVISGIFEMNEKEDKAIDLVTVSRQSARVIHKSLVFFQSKKDYYKKLVQSDKKHKSKFTESLKAKNIDLNGDRNNNTDKE